MIQSGKKTLLDYLNNPVQNEPPPGFKNIKQLSKEINLSQARTRIIATEGVEDGTVDVVQIKVGRVYTHYYRPRKNKK
jgi:hypothetical protein